MEYLKQSRLYQALCNFKGANGNINNLSSEFETIARAAFFTGHFLVNNTKRIYITDIEFYYHEDNGIIKDEVKYHRNYAQEQLPYFPIGSLHPHKSGVDVTFENPNSIVKFRASFLIRGYEIRDMNYTFIERNERKKQTKPTYLWDDLFGEVPFFSLGNMNIKWIDEDNQFANAQLSLIPRKRVHITREPEKNYKWRYTKI